MRDTLSGYREKASACMYFRGSFNSSKWQNRCLCSVLEKFKTIQLIFFKFNTLTFKTSKLHYIRPRDCQYLILLYIGCKIVLSIRRHLFFESSTSDDLQNSFIACGQAFFQMFYFYTWLYHIWRNELYIITSIVSYYQCPYQWYQIWYRTIKWRHICILYILFVGIWTVLW